MTYRALLLMLLCEPLIASCAQGAELFLPGNVLSSVTSPGSEPASASGQPDSHFTRLIFLRDYNTRVVILGTSLLGMAAGVVGTFTLLRRRALMGDALSHATLPGVGLAFLLAPSLGLDGKSLPVLLTGAALSGLCGVAAIMFVRNMTRLREDAALGIVLSVFFGAGISVFSVVQKSGGNAAGLETFIYGKAALLSAGDAKLIAIIGAGVTLVIVAMFRELTLLCFDEGFAASRGYPVLLLDILLMALVVITTIIGLKAVGLILMIALLVIPAAAARFWTDGLAKMTIIAAVCGGASGLLGSALSALFKDLPSGAMIVLVSAVLFFISMIIGTARGVLVRALRRRSLNQAIDREHLLRGLFELLESHSASHGVSDKAASVSYSELEDLRTWTPRRLRSQLSRSKAQNLVQTTPDGRLMLSSEGRTEARRLVHNHRLWELYLMTHAEVAAARVDREADAIEHVLEPELIAKLEALLELEHTESGIPESPHRISPASSGQGTAGASSTGTETLP